MILRRVDAEWCDPLELRGELAARRRRAHRGRAPRPRAARQRPGRRRAREPRPHAVHAGGVRAAARRAAAAAVRAHLVVRRPRGAEPRCSRRLEADPIGYIVRQIDGRAADLAGLDAGTAARADRCGAAPVRRPGAAAAVAGAARGATPAARRAGRIPTRSCCAPSRCATARSTDRSSAGSRRWSMTARPRPARRTSGCSRTPPATRTRASSRSRRCHWPAPCPCCHRARVEDMFWSGRYAERAEDLLRLVITAQRARRAAGLHVHARRAAPRCVPCIGVLQRLCGTALARHGSRACARCCSMPTARAPRRTRSQRLRDALEGVRDQLSVDTWRAFGSTDRAMKALRARSRPTADRRVGRPDAERHPVAAGRDREHDPRRRLARDRGRPLPRAGAAGVHAAGGDHDRLRSVSTSTGRCSTAC